MFKSVFPIVASQSYTCPSSVTSMAVIHFMAKSADGGPPLCVTVGSTMLPIRNITEVITGAMSTIQTFCNGDYPPHALSYLDETGSRVTFLTRYYQDGGSLSIYAAARFVVDVTDILENVEAFANLRTILPEGWIQEAVGSEQVTSFIARVNKDVDPALPSTAAATPSIAAVKVFSCGQTTKKDEVTGLWTYTTLTPPETSWVI